jgi:hypothetical protein
VVAFLSIQLYHISLGFARFFCSVFFSGNPIPFDPLDFPLLVGCVLGKLKRISA